MGKVERKIEKNISCVMDYLDNISEKRISIERETNPKKIEKLNKKINSDIRVIMLFVKNLNDLGADIQGIISSFGPQHQALMREILPSGTDNDTIKNQKKRNFLINEHKNRLNKLREAYEKYEMYDESLPIEEKLKNKIYKQEKEVGFFLYTESNKERKIYEPIWNYLEHIDETPEFTEEEKEILKHCYKIGEEYDKYRYERIDRKLNVIANAVGDVGYRKFAQGLSNNLFPKYAWMVYPNQNFSDAELKTLGKIMAARYITFASRKEELNNILKRRLEILNEIRGTDENNRIYDIYVKTTEDEDAQLFTLLKEEFDAEDALFVHLYTDDPYIAEILDGLAEYSFKELGLE